MIAAGLIIADRRPGNRIGPLAILTGFVWFVGDFTNSDVAVVAYLANLAHGWFDPLFAVVVLAYPTGRIVRRVDRALAIGFIAVQAGWTLAKAYGMRPIGWWDCPTCISTVDRWMTAYAALDPLGRIETFLLTGLSLGLLIAVASRWLSASGAARRRQTPVVLAGIVLAGGSSASTSGRPSCRPAVASRSVSSARSWSGSSASSWPSGLLIGVLRDDAARGRIADLVVRLDGLPPLPVLQASLRDALGDPSLAVYRWEPSLRAFTDATGQAAIPPTDGAARAVLAIGTAEAPELVIAHDPALRDDPGLVSAAAAAVRLAVENERLQAEVGPSSKRSRRRGHASSRRRTTSDADRARPPRRRAAAPRLAPAVTPDAPPRPGTGRGSRCGRGARGGHCRGRGCDRRHPRAGAGCPPGDPQGGRPGAGSRIVGRPSPAAGRRDRRARSTAAQQRRGDRVFRRRPRP
jgi:hypothetical protein